MTLLVELQDKVESLAQFLSLWTKAIEGQTWRIRDWLKSDITTKEWYLPSSSTRIEPLATAVADFRTLRGVQGEDQEKGAVCSGKAGRTGLQTDTSSGKLYEPTFFHLPILRASLWLRGWRICLPCGRPAFSPWVRKIPWRREWLPTSELLHGELYGLRSLVGYSPRGRTELDKTERLTPSLSYFRKH